MTEEQAKPKKAAASKAPKAESKKEAAPKAASKAAPAKKAAKPTSVGAGQIKIVQIGSPIARQAKQRATLIGLGLNKMHRESILKDSPQVRGMINKVQHLVKVVG